MKELKKTVIKTAYALSIIVIHRERENQPEIDKFTNMDYETFEPVLDELQQYFYTHQCQYLIFPLLPIDLLVLLGLLTTSRKIVLFFPRLTTGCSVAGSSTLFIINDCDAPL
jgi:hypothetical protein